MQETKPKRSAFFEHLGLRQFAGSSERPVFHTTTDGPQPSVDFSECVGRKRVYPAITGRRRQGDTRVPKDLKMLRYRRLSDAQFTPDDRHNFSGRSIAERQQLDSAPAHRVGQDFEDIHTGDLYGNISLI